MTTWNDVLTQALQGDTEAIAAVAQRLESGPNAEEKRSREDFNDAVASWRDENPDLLLCDGDPESAKRYRRVIEEDLRLSKDPDYCQLDFRTRLDLAGNRVRRGLGIAEANCDADNAIEIQRMQRSRPGWIAQHQAESLADTDSQAIRRMGRPQADLEDE